MTPYEDKHGHTFVSIITTGLGSEALIGWECEECDLFVMTEGEHPETAPKVYVSGGWFGPHSWNGWTHREYLQRANETS